MAKSGGILCKGNQLEAYRFIDQYHDEFGMRWLLNRLDIYPNAYYNYRKHRKANYYAHKEELKAQIDEIYHQHNGVDGYRSMAVYLSRGGYSYSLTTIHQYMNVEIGLRSIVRPKKPDAVEEFSYVTNNHVRPHSYNGYKTPFEARRA